MSPQAIVILTQYYQAACAGRTADRFGWQHYLALAARRAAR